ANSTSLTADEATRFATEIGKAMRILGAGGDQAKEITKYVEVMAARMKDAGGDSQDVVEAFKLMTKGSPEAIRLQSLAGIRGPEQAGTLQAFQGIDRMIKSLVRAA